MYYSVFKKIISGILILSITVGSIGVTGELEVYAQGINVNSLDNIGVIELSDEQMNRYQGVDLFDTQFDINNMNSRERELYNLLLEKEYDKQRVTLSAQGISKEKFINEVKSYLYKEFGMNRLGNNVYRVKATRLISVSALGSALNVVITAALIVTGVGSIGELVKNLGKEGARRWVKKHLSSKIVGVLANIGASKLEVWVGAFVVGLVDTYLDPGTFLARQFDSIDLVPHSGYIELW